VAWGIPRTWTNGEIVTQTMLNTDVRDNMRELWHEVAYVEFTADVTIAGVAEATPTDIVSAGAITYVANPIIVEFFSPRVLVNTGGVSLWDGTDLGRLGRSAGSALIDGPFYAWRRFTPTAASHTYKVRGWGNFTAEAGAWGVGTDGPGFIRITQKGGT
jgi:hypothetical protein